MYSKEIRDRINVPAKFKYGKNKANLATDPSFGSALDLVEIDAHYSGYLKRQSHDIAAFKKDESLQKFLNILIMTLLVVCQMRSSQN